MELAKDNGYIRKEEKMINGNLKLEWAVPWVEGLNLSATGNYRYGFNAFKSGAKMEQAMLGIRKNRCMQGFPDCITKRNMDILGQPNFLQIIVKHLASIQLVL